MNLEQIVLYFSAIMSVAIFAVDATGTIAKKMEGKLKSQSPFNTVLLDLHPSEILAFKLCLTTEIVAGVPIFLLIPYYIAIAVRNGIGNQLFAYGVLGIWVSWLVLILWSIKSAVEELHDPNAVYRRETYRTIRRLIFFIPTIYLWYLIFVTNGYLK